MLLWIKSKEIDISRNALGHYLLYEIADLVKNVLFHTDEGYYIEKDTVKRIGNRYDGSHEKELVLQ